MDIARPPSTQPSKAHQFQNGRPPTPDSGFEIDEGSSGAISGADDMTSDQEGARVATRKVNAKETSAEASVKKRALVGRELVAVKGVHGQDSDVDSGIVSCRKPGQRIGSTSSADTDSSQESRGKIDYSSPTQKGDQSLKSKSSTSSVRGCKSSAGGPVKGDHSVLKECNRRPPTPLTVFSESHHCVRFDEQLQLSEQSIRRSCRKLFATLYAQRFSYPSSNSPLPNHVPNTRFEPITTRNRSRTLPESELRKNYATCHGVNHSNTKSKLTMDVVNNNKENSVSAVGNRKAVSWNLKNAANKLSEHKSNSDLNLSKQVSFPPHFQHKEFRVPDNISTLSKKEHPTAFRTTSTDSGLGWCRARCTCPNPGRSHCGSSSQSSTSSSSSSSNHCCCCNYNSQPHSTVDSNRVSLFKSSSCSVLSNALLQRGMRPSTPAHTSVNTQQRMELKSSSNHAPLQKTSSCSNLYNKAQTFQFTNVPVYNDNMIHAYAHIASVVPDDIPKNPTAQKSSRVTPYSRSNSQTENIYDTIRTPNCTPPSSISASSVSPYLPQKYDKVRFQLYETPKRSVNCVSVYEDSKVKKSLEFQRTRSDSLSVVQTSPYSDERVSNSSSSDIYSQLDNRVPFRKSPRASTPTGGIATVRPRTTSALHPNSSPRSIYLKSALKQSPKTTSHLNGTLGPNPSESHPALNGLSPCEVEYAVVDKSKKNRFASLPALNRLSSNSCLPDGEDKDHPPVPPKKNLHKSDFSLYRSRSFSPKKSLLERVQGFTRSAASALQRAFSTERIYRPEREERLDASGLRGLQRSRSFVKGLRASVSRKKRKTKPPMAEVVPQASSNPVWDELPSGPNSPLHVRGQLLQLNLDGSQVVELSKPPSKPYGFFVARGRVRNSRGVFVSRMRDQETQRQLAGLLDIGDEILEIEGSSVKNSDIMEVNNLMANKNRLLLTVLPYICRKDI